MSEKEVKADVVHGDFVQVLHEVNKGQSVAELSVALESLVKAVRETGKAGKLRYELAVKPATEGEVDEVFVEDGITLKLPVAPRRKSIFFATPKGTLSRENPNQMEMFGKEE